MDHRQPLRVGWARYCRLWVDHHADLLRARTRPVWGPIAGAASEVAWVVRLTAGSAAARLARARPGPWTDGRLFALVSVIALGSLAVAGVLGFALAEWAAANGSDDVLPAAGGAVVVGGALSALVFVVFASAEPERRGPEEG
ncbi:hypothetical protein ACFPZ0_23160 [Streptomonospora nanhaiensis]|uniref:Uncharacterized protein n=1 Tax=Streptomonospora nanhaiensis TaxID=1323731 RepID=A0A853BGN2_9ACTN|nr:hypothetical protein [Streptomonospora nanhaiensis]MBV2366139.1 hypothetical protein [Streptomonospora nanhaiensis]MBX9390220.1 hypothetical protein [Streptomonospora nanhaiensis]NYI93884.1 hypothetical protein [Streptomonospora nanhaiensis]